MEFQSSQTVSVQDSGARVGNTGELSSVSKTNYFISHKSIKYKPNMDKLGSGWSSKVADGQ